jgi:hypothetical protein
VTVEIFIFQKKQCAEKDRKARMSKHLTYEGQAGTRLLRGADFAEVLEDGKYLVCIAKHAIRERCPSQKWVVSRAVVRSRFSLEFGCQRLEVDVSILAT